MPDTRLSYLLDCFFEDKATDEETQELMSELANTGNEDEIKAVMERVWEEHESKRAFFSVEKSKSILAGILKVHSLPEYKKAKRKWRSIYAAAAVVMVLFGSAVVYQLAFKKMVSPGIAKMNTGIPKKNIETTDIVPGGDKAVLTLANGSAIVLDSISNGALGQQGNSTITKSGGHLLYGTDKARAVETAYNTLTTPKGGQYHLTLADGREVWLNVSSSIRFPAAFNEDERNVEITGEVYFEVAKNASKPFHVKVHDMKIEVLGTHFNIMAYSDEATINTTLLEGAVKVWGSKTSGLLHPGQQSKFNKTSQELSVSNADTEKAVAWKNGMFMFKRDNIKSIVGQISRWYDVDITYTGEVSSRKYSGTISKYVNASEVLRILELGGIKFRIEGKRITVL